LRSGSLPSGACSVSFGRGGGIFFGRRRVEDAIVTSGIAGGIWEARGGVWEVRGGIREAGGDIREAREKVRGSREGIRGSRTRKCVVRKRRRAAASAKVDMYPNDTRTCQIDGLQRGEMGGSRWTNLDGRI
jgi:hypothetical protein